MMYPNEARSAQQLQLLKERHLQEFFMPYLHISVAARKASLQGFYELDTANSEDLMPVYHKYNNKYWLYLAGGCWWISTKSEMLSRKARGVAHSAQVNRQSLALPEASTGWWTVENQKWESTEVQIQGSKEPKAEFVVVSLAGGELLRKDLLLEMTVLELKADLLRSKLNKPYTIRLCLHTQQLKDQERLGSLPIAAGDTLQAIFLPILCKRCGKHVDHDRKKCKQCKAG